MDVYHSSDFEELEAIRLGRVDNAPEEEPAPAVAAEVEPALESDVEVVTKDVTPEQVEQARAELV